MWNYEAVLYRAAESLRRPLALCGWSMGGLVAMLAARRVEPELLVLLEPSAPGEVQGFDLDVRVEPGTFDPEAVYGPFPAGVRARPESALARAERKRGLSVPELAFPTLVVSGADFAEERGRRVAERYGAEELRLAGASHWDLVLDPELRRRYLSRSTS
jgi:pimeloyl-ACP methyl ester carboxylesterase